jgi:hypothetical protein
VGVHVAGVLLASRLHRENLVGRCSAGTSRLAATGHPQRLAQRGGADAGGGAGLLAPGSGTRPRAGARLRPAAPGCRGPAAAGTTRNAANGGDGDDHDGTTTTTRENPMRILLAEDDPLLGDGLRAGLRQQGFQVDWVRDGRPPSANCAPSPTPPPCSTWACR